MPDSNAKKLAQFLTSSGTYNLYDVQADSTGFFDLPSGTTAQRPSPTSGMIRYNSTLNLAEYYDGVLWKAIDAPPTVSGVSPTSFDAEGDTITVTGSNFQTGATVTLVGNSGTTYNAASVTRNSSTELTFDITAGMDTNDDPFGVRVVNPSGLSGTYSSLDYQSTPAWVTSAGSLGTYYNYTRTGLSYTVAASTIDSDDTITYAITSGSLPSGLSLTASTGVISGDAASVGSSTTYTFGITATATSDVGGGTLSSTERSFTLTNAAYVVTSYTSTGSGTFSVPSGITTVDVLVVAGGGGGGSTNGGGGGAGGLVYAPAYPVTPGGSISYTVGAGGGGADERSGSAPDNQSRGDTGTNSTFGQLTANGGGGGGSRGDGGVNYAGEVGNPGGSGGGGSSSDNPGQAQPGGSANQPSNGGHPTGQGFGNAGGSGGVRSPHNAGGGGGAGAAGDPAQANVKRYGGIGKQYDISGSQVYYAGGGAGFGGSGPSDSQWNAGGQGGGGDTIFSGDVMQHPLGRDKVNGTANRGGGGGSIGSNIPEAASPAPQNGTGGTGGSGIIIIKY
jgi:hypothetical protein